MKKLLVGLLLVLILTSCNIPRPTDELIFEKVVATEVAAARTATAAQDSSHSTIEAAKPAPSQSMTATPVQVTSSVTPTAINFNEKLGMPGWKDELNSGGGWSLSKPNTDMSNVTIKVENGALSMSRSVPYGGKNWWLNYQQIKDFYLQAKFITRLCSSDDQYGLVFRAPNYNSGMGYYFTITCDGHFNLMRWDGSGAANLFTWEKTDAIQTGSNQTNLLGIWAKQNVIRLYANGVLLKEISDDALINKGHFGLFLDSRQTPGFSIELDEIAYWENPNDF